MLQREALGRLDTIETSVNAVGEPSTGPYRAASDKGSEGILTRLPRWLTGNMYGTPRGQAVTRP